MSETTDRTSEPSTARTRERDHPPSTDPTAGTRLHALDAVRAGALILGVILHAGFAFLPGGVWLINDNSSSLALSDVIFVIHMFRMTLFFLIAGFFARLLLHRRGVGGLIRNRLTRIALPLVIGLPLVLTAFALTLGWFYQRHPLPAGMAPPSAPPGVPLTHLWFLYVLLWLYSITLLVRGVVGLLDRRGLVLTRVVDPLVRSISGPWAPLVLAVPAWLMFIAAGQPPWWGVPTPDTGLLPNSTALVAYGAAFGFGWLVHRQADLLRVWARLAPWFLGLGVATGVTCLIMVGGAPDTEGVGPSLRVVYLACYAVGTWAWTLGLLGAATRWLTGAHPRRRYLADASYWIYLVHLPIVVFLQAVTFDLRVAWWIKLPLILVVAFAVMLVSYQYLVRYTFIGAVLNGRKRRLTSATPT